MKNKNNNKFKREYRYERDRNSIRKSNSRNYMYNAVHQSLDLEVNSSSKIKSLYKAPIHGVRYKANADTIIKGLLDVKPFADASEETFLNQIHAANVNTTGIAGQVPDLLKAMYIIPSRAQTPDLRTIYNGSNNNTSTYTMPRTRDFVNSCNNIFTLLQSNSAYSSTPIMSYSTYVPSVYNVKTLKAIKLSSTFKGLADSNPFWQAATTQNAIWSFADSACVNVAAVSAILMTWRQDRILLDVMARRHPDIAGWIQNAKALISQPRFRSLLENIARLLARIPVDADWVDRVVRLSTAVSQKSDSVLDPVIYTVSSFMMPAYSIGTSTESGSGYFFTPDFRNTGWRTENVSMPCQPFYDKVVEFGTTPNTPDLISSLNDPATGSNPLSTVQNWVNNWYSILATTLAQTSSLVNMYEPWTSLVRLAAQSGFSKWFGYTVPYLEDHKPSYEANIHNLLRYPSVKMTSFEANGNAKFDVTAERGIVNEDSVSPYKVYTIATEYSLNQLTDSYSGNLPHFTPIWQGNSISPVDGVISNAPYQLPELIMYTFIYITTYNTNTISMFQNSSDNFTNNGVPVMYTTTAAWYTYYGFINNDTSNGFLSLTNAPIGTPTYNYLIDTLGAIALNVTSTPESQEFMSYAPLYTASSSSFPISVIIPNITMHLQNDFRATSPFREVMKNPGNTLLLG